MRKTGGIIRAAGLLAVTAASWALAADENAGGAGGDDVPLAVSFAQPPAAEPQPIVRFAKAPTTWVVVGRAGGEVAWQFGFDEQVLRQGSVPLDAAGIGRLHLELPEVRQRVACTMLLKEAKTEFRFPVVVLPRRSLALAEGTLERMNLGVVDSRGLVQKALGEEGVRANDLRTDLARDNFRGGAVLLAGFARAEAMNAACATFESRLAGGQWLAVASPPAGWTRWGLTVEEPNQPQAAPVKFAEPTGQILKGEDLGSGPWARVLSVDANWAPLAWAEQAAKDPNGVERVRRHPLIAARKVGAGGVVVIGLPQAADPAGSAVGRGILNETLLWLVRERSQRR